MSALHRHVGLPLALILAVAPQACAKGGDSTSPPGPAATVAITPASQTLTAIGATAQLSAAAEDAAGNAVTGTATWSSADESVATVGGSGLVTAVGDGSVEISATIGSAVGTAQITVTQAASAVTVDPASLSLEVGGTEQLNASVTDANGNAVAGATVAWTSSADSVVSVDASGLATAVAAGSAVVTATAGTASGTADATVTAPVPLEPNQDTTLTGTMVAADVMIPQGVTVTLAGDVTLTSRGAVTIAGTLTGDCMSAMLHGQSDVTVTGTVTTACSTAPDSGAADPTLSILSDGVLTFDRATVTSGGSLSVGNPDAVAAAGGSGAAAAVRRDLDGPAQAGAGGSDCYLTNSFLYTLRSPRLDGRSGKPIVVACDGDWHITGGLKSAAGAPGSGAGSGTKVVGKPGGNGGDISIIGKSKVIVDGSLKITVGDGGMGGPVVAYSEDPTVPAMATGGNGGDAGKLEVNVPFTGGGTVSLLLGTGGAGGGAEAGGARGSDSHPKGGDAVAQGGNGGAAPAVAPEGSAVALVFTASPQGGKGGEALVAGGHGADAVGVSSLVDGGDGGSYSASGGRGGDVTDDIGIPGTGGDLVVGDSTLADVDAGNNGGTGRSACDTWGVGGDGGYGGDVEGSPGGGGSGPVGGPSGKSGNIIYWFVGNGGWGGDGLVPGKGGGSGRDDVSGRPGSAITGTDRSFYSGFDGGGCYLDAATELTVVSDPNGHDPFTQYSQISGVTLETGANSAIRLKSDDPRWVTLTGTLSGATGGRDDFTASGTGTVAGFSGIPVSITGKLTRDANGGVTGFTGTVTIDGSKLPANSSGEHNDVTYDITGRIPDGGASG